MPKLQGPLAIFLVCAFGFTGCKRSDLPAGVATNVQSAFKSTSANVREFAEQGVEAEGKGDFGTAFVHYRALSLNPELTQEQRNAADKSMIEMGKKLREAAAKGDKDAEKVLDNYRATR
jgi:hypothetical protein